MAMRIFQNNEQKMNFLEPTQSHSMDCYFIKNRRVILFFYRSFHDSNSSSFFCLTEFQIACKNSVNIMSCCVKAFAFNMMTMLMMAPLI